MGKALNTNKTRFLIKPPGATTWTDFRIKAYPAPKGVPNQIESTDLMDEEQTFILGIRQSDSKELNMNYTKEDYVKLEKYENTPGVAFLLAFGETGADGSWEGEGEYSISPNEGEVDAVREMTLTVTLTSPFTDSDEVIPAFPADNWPTTP